MADQAASPVVKSALGAARRLRVGEGLRIGSRFLPRRVTNSLDTLRARVRARSGDMDGLVAELGSTVPEAELERCYENALTRLSERQGPDNVGDYLEFGVYTGSSLACMHRALEKRGLRRVRLFGFDSFEGLPDSALTDDTAGYGLWSAGDYNAPIGLTREVLRHHGVDMRRVTLVKGWYEDTLTDACISEHDLQKAGVIMIDCDLFSSAATALQFCAPLIRDEAVVLFDDWFPATLAADGTGERHAFEEFLATNPTLSVSELESYAPEEAKVFLVTRTEADITDGNHG